jgi:putative acetyltransferase
MSDKIEIRLDDLSGEPIKNLLETHLKNAALHSPEEAIFALDLDALKAPEISIWSVWQNKEILACGAIKMLDTEHAEIKSMHTLEKARGKGIGNQLVNHIIQQARAKNIKRLSLETGTAEAYFPAHRLYKRHGFQECPPFADYLESVHSLYMTKAL